MGIFGAGGRLPTATTCASMQSDNADVNLLVLFIFILTGLLFLGLRKLIPWLRVRRRINKEIAEKLGSRKPRWPKILTRFGVLYCLYLGVSYPFVSESRSDGVWLVGVLFAIAATYVWCQIQPFPEE